MRLSLRFLAPLAIVLAAIAYTVLPLVDSFMFQWFMRDSDVTSTLVSNSVQDSLIDLVASASRSELVASFGKVIKDQRLFALGYCDATQQRLVATPARSPAT